MTLPVITITMWVWIPRQESAAWCGDGRHTVLRLLARVSLLVAFGKQ